MHFNRPATLLVTAFVLLPGYTIQREPKEPRRPPSVPKVCVQPTDKQGRIQPTKDKDVKTLPHCPNPEIAQTPSPRRVEK